MQRRICADKKISTRLVAYFFLFIFLVLINFLYTTENKQYNIISSNNSVRNGVYLLLCKNVMSYFEQLHRIWTALYIFN